MPRLLTAALALLPAVAVSGDLVAASRPPRPNFVVIMFDDMSPRIGAFGDRLARTPNIDAVAQEGIRYPNTFVTAPVCAPSRAALFSGRHQQTITAQHMRTKGAAGLPGGGPIDYEAVPPAQVKWLPELLRARGYFTINVGKTDYQIGDPFTIWDVNAPQADWRKRPKDKPFFAFINLQRTHESYIWPEDLETPNPLVRRVVARNRAELAGKQRLTDPEKVRVPTYLPDTPAVRADIARIYDNIAFDEREVGKIMAALKADGDLENTVVIISSDHGDGLPRIKRAIYDSGIRVPLVIRLPKKAAANQRRDQLVSFVDIAPTILNVAGLPVPRWMHGKPFLGPRSAARNSYVFAGADRFDEVREWQRSVLDGRYQYVRNLRPDVPFFRPLAFRDVLPTMQELWRLHRAKQLSPAAEQYFAAPRAGEELYDLTSDPDTVRNVAGHADRALVLRRMRRAYDRWVRLVGDDSIDPEQQMIGRIWPGMRQPATAAPTIALGRDARGRLVRLSSPTAGASIGYRLGADAPWLLYARPVRVDAGTSIEAKAVRYGYAESPISKLVAR
jgi:arylsulfatase A-like enzyme